MRQTPSVHRSRRPWDRCCQSLQSLQSPRSRWLLSYCIPSRTRLLASFLEIALLRSDDAPELQVSVLRRCPLPLPLLLPLPAWCHAWPAFAFSAGRGAGWRVFRSHAMQSLLPMDQSLRAACRASTSQSQELPQCDARCRLAARTRRCSILFYMMPITAATHWTIGDAVRSTPPVHHWPRAAVNPRPRLQHTIMATRV